MFQDEVGLAVSDDVEDIGAQVTGAIIGDNAVGLPLGERKRNVSALQQVDVAVDRAVGRVDGQGGAADTDAREASG